jgi:hypothetical protein
MQMLLNKNVSFPEAAPVQFDQIGKAFVEIVKPEKFNQLKCHTHAPGYSLIAVLTFVLRNVFAHMREEDFRVAVTTGGGILDATKLWLQEDAAEPHDSLNLGFWRAFDVAEYIFHGSLFGCVFPLCYRLIRTKLRSDHVLPPRYRQMLLQCMPAAHFDFEIPSSLDWYVHASLCITILKSCAQVLRPRGRGLLAQGADDNQRRRAAAAAAGPRQPQPCPARREAWALQARDVAPRHVQDFRRVSQRLLCEGSVSQR